MAFQSAIANYITILPNKFGNPLKGDSSLYRAQRTQAIPQINQICKSAIDQRWG